MQYHQSAAERFAESIFGFISKEFDGKTVNSDEFNLELFMKKLPKDIDDEIDLVDHLTVYPLPDPDNQANDSEIFQDNIPTPKKDKKDKKKKKSENNESTDTENKPKKKKPLNAYFFFKQQPETIEKIETYAGEHPDITDKRKIAKALWDDVSEEDREEWKQKSITEFEKNNTD
jgi:hypothetical protein